MKLNNHGWGLNEMLILMAVLLSFLLVAIFFVIQLSNALGDTFQTMHGKVTYTDVEDTIKAAATSYINEFYEYEIGSGTITVTTENLIKYEILDASKLKPTDEKSSCKGYVLVSKDKEALLFAPYITCDNYETKGYQSWRLGE